MSGCEITSEWVGESGNGAILEAHTRPPISQEDRSALVR